MHGQHASPLFPLSSHFLFLGVWIFLSNYLLDERKQFCCVACWCLGIKCLFIGCFCVCAGTCWWRETIKWMNWPHAFIYESESAFCCLLQPQKKQARESKIYCHSVVKVFLLIWIHVSFKGHGTFSKFTRVWDWFGECRFRRRTALQFMTGA